jgi:excisionase family DNA binding protein
MTGPRSHMDNDKPVIDRITVPEAAKLLGITQSAVHKRISRGQIRWEKTEEGRTYVFLTPSDIDGQGHDKSTDRVPDTSTKDELISELRDRVHSLESQLERRDEEMRRKDVLLVNMTDAMKALTGATETPPEPRESPVSRSGDTGSTEAPSQGEQRSWWRRFFGV